MDNLNDLKTIWLTAKTDSLPTSAEMVQLIKKFRNRKIFEKIVLIVSACVLALLMVAIMVTYKSTMPTTRIGEFLIVAACGILATTNIRSIKRFYRLDHCSNKEFVEFLEQTRKNQLYYYKNTQVVGLLFCSIGLLLYLYEIVHQNTLLFIIVYAVTITYLIVLWFIIRPRKFKKGIDKLNATRERLEKIL